MHPAARRGLQPLVAGRRYRPCKQRYHDLVMSRDLVALPAPRPYGPFHDVHAWPVVPDHIEVRGGECTRRAVVNVARDGECLEEDLGHDHGRAEVQDDATLESFQVGGKAGASGNLAFSIDHASAPANDYFSDAQPILNADLPYSDAQPLRGASYEVDEPYCDGQILRSVWYSFTPASDTFVSVDTLGAGDNLMALLARGGLGRAIASKALDAVKVSRALDFRYIPANMPATSSVSVISNSTPGIFIWPRRIGSTPS